MNLIVFSRSAERLIVYSRLLNRTNVNVLQALDGPMLLRLAAQVRPDVIVVHADAGGLSAEHDIPAIQRLTDDGCQLIIDGEPPHDFAELLRRRNIRPARILGQHDREELLRVLQSCTAREALEIPLRRGPDPFQDLFNAHADGMLILDEHGVVQFANDAAGQLFGRPSAALLETPFSAPFIVDGSADLEISTPTGEIRVAELRMAEVVWHGERAWLASLRDVTEIRSASQRLLEQAELLSYAQSLGRMGSWRMNLVSGKLLWSESILELFGFAGGEFPETLDAFIACVHEDDRPHLEARHARLSPANPEIEVEYRIRRRDGQLRHVFERGAAIFDAEDVEIARVGMVSDITEQKEATARLEVALSLLRVASKAARVGAWIMRFDDLVQVDLSEELVEILELPENRPRSRDEFLQLFPSAESERVGEALDACLREPQDAIDIETRVNVPRSPGLSIRLIGEAVRDAGGGIVRLEGAIQDISTLRAAEAASEEISARLLQTIDAMDEGFLMVDERMRLIYVNDRARSILDDPCAPGRELMGLIPEEIRSEFLRRCEQSIVGQHAVDFEGGLGKDRVIRAKLDPQGENLAIFLEDVSRVRALQRQLEQTQHLESLGQLTGGVAHDFNNLLTVILGNAEILSIDEDLSEKHRRLAQMVHSAAESGATLTQRLLAFARRQVLEPAKTDVVQLMQDMLNLLKRTIGQSVRVEFLAADDVWPVLIDPAQLESAILNLAINARDAMNGTGQLTIEVGTKTVGPKDTGIDTMMPGDYVQIAVSDTGAGIAPEDLDKIFEPFYTTKPKGKGTGLGLAMVYGFTTQSNGHIRVSSALDKGTTVSMYLPRHYDRHNDVAADSASPGRSIEGLWVLVVEDEPQVRQLVCAQLRALGLRVIETSCGADALKELGVSKDPIDLLFTDVMMPSMTGWELANQVRALIPDLPILFTSGYLAEAASPGVIEHERTEFIGKPFRREQLASKLQTLLS